MVEEWVWGWVGYLLLHCESKNMVTYVRFVRSTRTRFNLLHSGKFSSRVILNQTYCKTISLVLNSLKSIYYYFWVIDEFEFTQFWIRPSRIRAQMGENKIWQIFPVDSICRKILMRSTIILNFTYHHIKNSFLPKLYIKC